MGQRCQRFKARRTDGSDGSDGSGTPLAGQIVRNAFADGSTVVIDALEAGRHAIELYPKNPAEFLELGRVLEAAR